MRASQNLPLVYRRLRFGSRRVGEDLLILLVAKLALHLFLESRFQCRAAQDGWIGEDQSAVPIDQVRGWNSCHAIELRDIGVPRLAVAELRPDHFLASHNLAHFIGRSFAV